jgi:hypothetical protein
MGNGCSKKTAVDHSITRGEGGSLYLVLHAAWCYLSPSDAEGKAYESTSVIGGFKSVGLAISVNDSHVSITQRSNSLDTPPGALSFFLS